MLATTDLSQSHMKTARDAFKDVFGMITQVSEMQRERKIQDMLLPLEMRKAEADIALTEARSSALAVDMGIRQQQAKQQTQLFEEASSVLSNDDDPFNLEYHSPYGNRGSSLPASAASLVDVGSDNVLVDLVKDGTSDTVFSDIASADAFAIPGAYRRGTLATEGGPAKSRLRDNIARRVDDNISGLSPNVLLEMPDIVPAPEGADVIPLEDQVVEAQGDDSGDDDDYPLDGGPLPTREGSSGESGMTQWDALTHTRASLDRTRAVEVKRLGVIKNPQVRAMKAAQLTDQYNNAVARLDTAEHGLIMEEMAKFPPEAQEMIQRDVERTGSLKKSYRDFVALQRREAQKQAAVAKDPVTMEIYNLNQRIGAVSNALRSLDPSAPEARQMQVELGQLTTRMATLGGEGAQAEGQQVPEWAMQLGELDKKRETLRKRVQSKLGTPEQQKELDNLDNEYIGAAIDAAVPLRTAKDFETFLTQEGVPYAFYNGVLMQRFRKKDGTNVAVEIEQANKNSIGQPRRDKSGGYVVVQPNVFEQADADIDNPAVPKGGVELLPPVAHPVTGMIDAVTRPIKDFTERLSATQLNAYKNGVAELDARLKTPNLTETERWELTSRRNALAIKLNTALQKSKNK